MTVQKEIFLSIVIAATTFAVGFLLLHVSDKTFRMLYGLTLVIYPIVAISGAVASGLVSHKIKPSGNTDKVSRPVADDVA